MSNDEAGRQDVVAGKPLDHAYIQENLDLLRAGLGNLQHHITNVLSFGIPVVVAVNSFANDTPAEVELVCQAALEAGAEDSVVARHWMEGGAGATALAEAVVKSAEKPSNFKFLYPLELSIKEKIENICKEIYGADGVDYLPEAEAKVALYTRLGFDKLPVCMAKTHLSLSHDPNLKGVPKGWTLPIRDVLIYSGAKFLCPMAGTISLMPDFDRIMREGNNGGYANAWLVGDTNTGEIARLELGLRNVTLERTRDGYFVGTNFPVSPKLAAEETKFRLDDPSLSANARRVRADEILKAGEGQVDLALAKRYLSDHYDSYEKRENAPSERSLCGHVDLSPRGMGDWLAPWGPAGRVQSKVADAALAKRMALEAAMGHPCGTHYRAEPHLAAHPDHAWAKPLMRYLVASPWTLFEAR